MGVINYGVILYVQNNFCRFIVKDKNEFFRLIFQKWIINFNVMGKKIAIIGGGNLGTAIAKGY